MDEGSQIHGLCQRLLAAADIEPDGYAAAYRDLSDKVAAALSQFRGTRNNLYLSERPAAIEHLLASALLTDMTCVFLPNSDQMRLFVPHRDTAPQSVRIPWPFVHALDPHFDFGSIGVGYLAASDTNAVARDLAPLIRPARVLVRPRPLLFIHPRPGVSGINPRMYPLDPDSPLGEWLFAQESPGGTSVQTVDSVDGWQQAVAVGEVMVPYLSGVSVADFAKILEDERDRIGSLRAAIEAAVESIGTSPDAAARVTRERVDPELAAITLQLRSITYKRSFRIAGAAVGTVTLAMLALSTGGMVSAITTFLGAKGVKDLCDEIGETIVDRLRVKERPFYPLWRILRAKD